MKMVNLDNNEVVLERLRRCDSSCGLRSQCAYRRKAVGRPPKRPGPCGRERALYRRAVDELAGECDQYGVVEAASDVGFVDVLIDRCMRVFVEEEQFFRDEKGKGKV